MNRRDLVRRLDHWRELIAPEWRITLVDDRPEDLDGNLDANAACTADDHYLHADIWINPDYLEEASSARLDVTLIHELVHLHFRDLRGLIDSLEPTLGKPVLELALEQFNAAEERAIDRLARVIGRYRVTGIAED